MDITRAVIPPESVFSSRIGDILDLRVSRFSIDTDRRIQRELEHELAPAAVTLHPVRGIVIDLRGNRGGRLNTAVAAVDLMLSKGVIATTIGRNPMADHTWSAGKGDLAQGRPIVVLVDGRTASAAEVMAAALADQGRAVVVGSATLGKGLVQAVKSDLPDEGELFVSWSRLVAPAGWPLQGLGVLPQVCTSLGQDALTQQLDSLDHGEQPMAAALARHRAARAPLPTADALMLRTACPASEAHDYDVIAAKFLITHPAAYQAARESPP
jgi:carboxyl-terminal processing protease